ncbi:MAG TPA: hypothetical protein VMU35_07915 [Methylomirabilota bacterium]|nr:hypothetical protein [Methylomirabilota bacterium]
MNFKTVISSSLILGLQLILLSSMVSGARCQISGVSYNYPGEALPSQQIQVQTTVLGSCASNGEDYYAVRVDLVDLQSSYIISSSDTPIGHNATDFNVTAVNPVTTPASNMTWPLQIHVYVIRAGGTNGVYLLDYQTMSNATIQVGATPMPESQFSSMFIVTSLVLAILVLSRRRSRGRI